MTKEYMISGVTGIFKAGVIFATFPYSKTEERQKDFLYSDPIWIDFHRILHRRGEGQAFREPDKMQDKILCQPIGWRLADDLVPLIEAGSVCVVKPESMDLCYELLMQGRVDFLTSNLVPGSLMIKCLYNLDEQQMVTFGTKNLLIMSDHLIVSKQQEGGAAYLEQFNQSLSLFEKTEQYDALLKKHGLFEISAVSSR